MKSLNLKRVMPVLMALSLLAGGGMNAFADGGPEDVVSENLTARGAEDNELLSLLDGRSCWFNKNYGAIDCDGPFSITPGDHGSNYSVNGPGALPGGGPPME